MARGYARNGGMCLQVSFVAGSTAPTGSNPSWSTSVRSGASAWPQVAPSASGILWHLMSTCASCLQPIVNQQQLVVIGTEVVHRGCVRPGMTTLHSRDHEALRNTQQALSEMTAAKERAERALATLTEQRNRLQKAASRHDAQLMLARATLRVEAERLLNEQLAVVAELRRELAATRVAQSTAVTPVHEPEQRDDAVQRFALLELD